jgi:hypothetical protein
MPFCCEYFLWFVQQNLWERTSSRLGFAAVDLINQVMHANAHIAEDPWI